MLKKMVPVIVSLLLLSSCASVDPADTAEDIQQAYLESQSVDMIIDITADYGDKVYPYKLSCRISDNEGEIIIREPEIIAGVIARIADDGVTLAFDGAEVYTGAILPEGLSPVDAVPVMVQAWKSGLVTESVAEPFGSIPCISIVFRINENVSLRTWFDEETQLPVHAEFSSDGYTVILCDFENVILE